MRTTTFVSLFTCSLLAVALSSCTTYKSTNGPNKSRSDYLQRNNAIATANYESRLPQHLNTGGQKTVLVDPNVHAWGAYDGNGNLVKAGIAVAGANYCPDIHRPCHTRAGTFHVNSLGSAGCKSSIYPLPRGGAPMPYCMFFNGSQGMHGTYPGGLAEANLSHGCVRMRIPDAEWLRYNFVSVGTKVIVKPY